MAKANHTPPVPPKPLGYGETYGLMDAVDQAKSRLKGTIGLMAIVIDSGREYDEGVVLTLERHLESDIKALDEAWNAAWDGIIVPLNPASYSGGPRSGGDGA